MKTKRNAKSKNAHGTSRNAVICGQMQPKCMGQNEHAFGAKRARNPRASGSTAWSPYVVNRNLNRLSRPALGGKVPTKTSPLSKTLYLQPLTLPAAGGYGPGSTFFFVNGMPSARPSTVTAAPSIGRRSGKFSVFQHEPLLELKIAAVGRRPQPIAGFFVEGSWWIPLCCVYKLTVLPIINDFHLALHLFGA